MNAMAVVLSPLASPQPAAPPAREGDARSGEFARCLGQAREGNDAAVDTADADTAAETDEAAEASDAPQRPAAKARGSREAAAARKGEARTVKEAPPKDTGATDAVSEADAPAGQRPRDDAAAPDLAALLPGWSPPVPPLSNAKALDSADALQAAAAAPGVGGATPPARDSNASRAAAPLEVQALRVATAVATNAPTATAPPTAPLQAVASEQKDTLSTTQTASAAMPTALALAAMPAAPKAIEAALPTAILPAPIDTPAFAPALATQLRWWANDGVQQAQLLLNPAEMGPVTVKIVIDGRDARIDFSADMAATRSAIEAALPVLAAALDDSGLKLSGGGVHDGSAQRQSSWHDRGVTHRTPGAGSADAGDALTGAGAPTAAAGRGLVDLVA